MGVMKFILLKSISFSEKCNNIFWRRFNVFLFKLNGVVLRDRPVIRNKVFLKMNSNSTFVIGNKFRFISGSNLNPLSSNILGSIFLSEGSKIIIGNNVGISSSVLVSFKEIIIGDNVLVGAGCLIMDTNGHSLNPFERRMEAETHAGRTGQGIIIDSDVWLGTNCSIYAGVHIGRGAVVAGNSIIRNDIPPYAVVLGNPAKIISFVFSPEEIVELEKKNYPKDERIPLEVLEKNYNKYYINRFKEIKQFLKL